MHRLHIPAPLRLTLLAIAGLYAAALVVLVAAGVWTPDQVAVPTAVAALCGLIAIWPQHEVAAARLERRRS